MSFLGSFGRNIRTLGSKALEGVATLGRKVSSVAGRAEGLVEKATPFLTSINPELGVGAMVLSKTLGITRNVASDISNASRQVRQGNLTGAGMSAQSALNNVRYN